MHLPQHYVSTCDIEEVVQAFAKSYNTCYNRHNLLIITFLYANFRYNFTCSLSLLFRLFRIIFKSNLAHLGLCRPLLSHVSHILLGSCTALASVLVVMEHILAHSVFFHAL